ncbi:MAG TPA: energy transducer TonB [Pyrinomonadaceae bacterium]|nr:energy transducer TonB [Pyrinomonadaceae bacterium]
MRPFALRLSAALLTFFVGVTLAALWYSPFSEKEEVEVVVAPAPPTALIAPQMPPQVEQPSRRMLVKGGVLNGKAISKPTPAYPPIAKAARASGTVVVQIIVDEEGKVESASAVSGHPLLQQASVVAARGARFSPTYLSGQPVKVSGVITYNFVLQ